MQHKLTVSLVVLIMFALMIAPVNSARAQDTESPRRTIGPSFFLHYPPISTAGSNPSLLAQNDLSAQSLTLGAPGLSYRYVQTFGATGQPYLADTTHLNRPMGLFMDGSDNLYVAESAGERVLKYNSAGSNLLAMGSAGICITDNYMFCSPNDMALDDSGNIWVADGNRVVEYDASSLSERVVNLREMESQTA